ncbi:unnamed protein product [Chrysodeixis includens]|uniref:Uncharacterized protein n=1 Tax=Chrysodeixis includens TaxID=689277 RepID=A0A9P0C0J8_CHRIL|nr:unnamed protein product [Chrysodeixis includens]
MVGVKTNNKQMTVYFGHPFQFWKERQRLEMKATVDVEDMKKLTDVVDYDLVHLQKLVINRTQDKVKDLLNQEERNL